MNAQSSIKSIEIADIDKESLLLDEGFHKMIFFFLLSRLFQVFLDFFL